MPSPDIFKPDVFAQLAAVAQEVKRARAILDTVTDEERRRHDAAQVRIEEASAAHAAVVDRAHAVRAQMDEALNALIPPAAGRVRHG